tara:strand:+ start:180 stop:323 length:144 start_codon:yes stop_codon:yes gene_type:complete
MTPLYKKIENNTFSLILLIKKIIEPISKIYNLMMVLNQKDFEKCKFN